MQAYVQSGYGSADLVSLQEVPAPVVAADEIRVRVAAAGLNAADAHLMRGEPRMVRLAMGLTRPRRSTPGSDVSGVVDAVGERVTTLSVGDRVMAEVDRGGLAELVCIKASWASKAPSGIDLSRAAAIPMAGMTALQALRDVGQLVPGERVLVVGASGGVGTFAVQIAAALGGRVTGVCSGPNVELVRSLGAADVIDYTRVDYTAGGEYELIVDVVASKPLGACRRLLAPGGRYVLVSAGTGKWLGVGRTLSAVVWPPLGGRRTTAMYQRPRAEDLDQLRALVDAGAVRPVVERVYPFDEAIAALRHIATGRTRGKVLVAVGRD